MHLSNSKPGPLPSLSNNVNPHTERRPTILKTSAICLNKSSMIKHSQFFKQNKWFYMCKPICIPFQFKTTVSLQRLICRFYIVTYISILSKKQQYDSYHVDVFPILKQGLVSDDWIHMHIPEKRILLSDHQLRIIDPDHYWRYPRQNVPCQVCVTCKIEHNTPTPCFRHVLQQTLLP